MIIKDKYITLTSPAGKFIIKRGTNLTHAKLVRDTVTASVMTGSPKPPRKSGFLKTWLLENLEGPARHIEIEWVR